jgi:hypothetical protein
MFGVQAQAQVERMVTGRVGFTEIENYIDDLVVLSDDMRSALWLFAWAETRRHERGMAERDYLDDLAHTEA